MYKTPQRIINQINNEIGEEKRLLLSIYNYLSKIYNNEQMAYTCALDDLYMADNLSALVNKKWGTNILGTHSFGFLIEFEQLWRHYRKTAPHGEDEIFVNIDPAWKKIVQDCLVPLLNSMENDFHEYGIEFISYKEYHDPDARPSDEEILERGRTLYDLLLKHGIIKKNI